jgi:hypothetical protein
VRYRYYTSHALIQCRKEHAGSVPRVPAPEVEALVCEALRRELTGDEIADKDLVARHVADVIVRRDRIEVERRTDSDREEAACQITLVVPFSPTRISQKGIMREPAGNGVIDAVAREKLLNAVRRATRRVEAVRSGAAKSSKKLLLRKE